MVNHWPWGTLVKALIKFTMAAFLMSPFVASVFAQGALSGSEAVDDRIYDIPTDVGKGLARAEDAAVRQQPTPFSGRHFRLEQIVNIGGVK